VIEAFKFTDNLDTWFRVRVAGTEVAETLQQEISTFRVRRTDDDGEVTVAIEIERGSAQIRLSFDEYTASTLARVLATATLDSEVETEAAPCP
jgi:hypothetical protein